MMAQYGAADVRMTSRAECSAAPRRCNAPTAPEIAVIMSGDVYIEHQASRDTILFARNESSRMLQYISETNCSYDLLHKVILSLRGK